MRIKTGDESIKTKSEIEAGNKDWLKLTAYHLTMPFNITILDPSVLFINLYTALVYGIYVSIFLEDIDVNTNNGTVFLL